MRLIVDNESESLALASALESAGNTSAGATIRNASLERTGRGPLHVILSSVSNADAALIAAAASPRGVKAVKAGTPELVRRAVVPPIDDLHAILRLRFDVADTQPRLLQARAVRHGLTQGVDFYHPDDRTVNALGQTVKADAAVPLVVTSYRYRVSPAGIHEQQMRRAYPAQDGGLWHFVDGDQCAEVYEGSAIGELGQKRRARVVASCQGWAGTAVVLSGGDADPADTIAAWLDSLGASLPGTPSGLELLAAYKDAGKGAPFVAAITADTTTAWLSNTHPIEGLTAKALILRELADLTLYEADGTTPTQTPGSGWTAWGASPSGWDGWPS